MDWLPFYNFATKFLLVTPRGPDLTTDGQDSGIISPVLLLTIGDDSILDMSESRTREHEVPEPHYQNTG